MYLEKDWLGRTWASSLFMSWRRWKRPCGGTQSAWLEQSPCSRCSSCDAPAGVAAPVAPADACPTADIKTKPTQQSFK